jgi:hypothetical protein
MSEILAWNQYFSSEEGTCIDTNTTMMSFHYFFSKDHPSLHLLQDHCFRQIAHMLCYFCASPLLRQASLWTGLHESLRKVHKDRHLIPTRWNLGTHGTHSGSGSILYLPLSLPLRIQCFIIFLFLFVCFFMINFPRANCWRILSFPW